MASTEGQKKEVGQRLIKLKRDLIKAANEEDKKQIKAQIAMVRKTYLDLGGRDEVL